MGKLLKTMGLGTPRFGTDFAPYGPSGGIYMKKTQLMILVALVVALTACKLKKSDEAATDLNAAILGDTTYDATTLDPKPTTPPPPVSKPSCGNYKKESGEQCDAGPKGDSKCDAACKDIKVVVDNKPPKDEKAPDNKIDTKVNCTESPNDPLCKIIGGAVAANAPVINTVQLDRALVKESYTFALDITCAVGPCSFSATGLPEGLSIDKDSGTISGTPTIEKKSAVTIKVTDGGVSTSKNFELVVGHRIAIKTEVTGSHAYAEAKDLNKDHVLNTSDYDPKEEAISADGTLGVPMYGYDDRFFGYVILSVEDTKGKYTWKITDTDGNAFTTVSGLAGYDDKTKTKDVSYIHIVSPNDGQLLYNDTVLNDVKVTVSDDKGNSGELTIGKLVFYAPQLSPEEIKDIKDKEIAKCKIAKPVTIKDAADKELVLGDETEGNVVTIGRVFSGTVKLVGGKMGAVTISTPMIEGCSTPTPVTEWQLKGNALSRTFDYKALKACTPNNDNRMLTETLKITVNDDTCNTSQDVIIKFSVQYPDRSTVKMAEVEKYKLWMEYTTNYTNSGTKVAVDLANVFDDCKNATLMATTVVKKIGDGGSSTLSDAGVQQVLLTPATNKTINDINAVCVKILDTGPASSGLPSTGNKTADSIFGTLVAIVTVGTVNGDHAFDYIDMDMTYTKTRIMTDYWYADIPSSVGETDGETNTWLYLSAMKFSEDVWKARPNPKDSTKP